MSKQGKPQTAKQQNCVGNSIHCLPLVGYSLNVQKSDTSLALMSSLSNATARERKRQVISCPSVAVWTGEPLDVCLMQSPSKSA